MKTSIPLLLTLVPVLGCASHRNAKEDASAAAPQRLEGMGAHHRAVTTSSEEAQRWFDQGLVLVFAFNHDEAIRSFEQATQLDPQCAMAWWGIALANGPHYNNPSMDAEHSKAAWDALEKARAATGANETERALVEALGHRYAATPPEDRGPLDAAYAEAMREMWRAHPRDADVGSLFAESLMDLHPWDLWTLERQPKADTPAIVETLEQVLALAPEHPGANHLYIHAIEASARPDRATESADRLRTLVPGAGHLVHMPAHIYARCGRWADASAANERAIEVDRAYRERSPNQGFYHIYMAHNHQFLAWASMMEGRSDVAVREARQMTGEIPEESWEPLAPFLDGIVALPYATLMRFGKWKEILREPEPRAYLPVTRALWHFARGTALASTGHAGDAEGELSSLKQIAKDLKEGTTVGNSSAKDVLAVAAHVLAGEIAAQRGKNDAAVAELRAAVKVEDTLRYDEPPDWLQPARHTLGAVLLRAGRAPEAEAVYREDLLHWPENGWALWGLARALEKQGRDGDAEAIKVRFRKAWERADVGLDTTCLCLPGV